MVALRRSHKRHKRFRHHKIMHWAVYNKLLEDYISLYIKTEKRNRFIPWYCAAYVIVCLALELARRYGYV